MASEAAAEKTPWNPCILIPVYNHEEAVPIILARLLPYALPIILVNDGSDERCTEVLRELAANNSQVFLHELAQNHGKGGAVKAGLLQARAQDYSHALQIDADGQHDSIDVPRFLAAGQAQPHAIISGCPLYDESVPRVRFYARYLTHVWIYINTLSFAIKDSMCGFRLYPVAAICALIESQFTGQRMDFDPEVLVRWCWRDGKIVNLPTKVQYPLDGVSHFALWRDNWLISRMHTRLFFGMLRRAPAILWRRLKAPDLKASK